MSKVVGRCWSCGHDLTEVEYGRLDSCPDCRKDTHVCRNCDFYDIAYNNHCRENQADRVVEKESSNFCDYFVPTMSKVVGQKSRNDMLSAAEALFKKK